MGNSISIDDLGVPLFQEASIFGLCVLPEHVPATRHFKVPAWKIPRRSEKRCSFFPFFQWTMLRKMRKMRQIHIPATSIAQWEAMVSRWRPSWNGTWPATPPASQMLRIWEQPWIPTAPMRASVILWRKNKVGRGCWMLLGWGGRWETTWFHSVPYFWPKKRSRKTQIPTIYPPTINHHLSTIFQPSTIINHQPSTIVPC